MDVFNNKNYCIDKSVLKTCRRGRMSITLPSLKKIYIYINNFQKKKILSISGIEPGSPGPKARVLTAELFRLRIAMGRKSLSVQTAASPDLSSECRFAWNETSVTSRCIQSGQ